MTRTVYLNGDWVAETEAKVSVFDRSFLMADGVYEVTTVLDGKLVDFDGHCTRLGRSCRELKMQPPPDRETLLEIHREIVRRNGLEEGMIYLQLSRGSEGDRDFGWQDPAPFLVLFTQAKSITESPLAERGAKVMLVPDLRWKRRDIKTV